MMLRDVTVKVRHEDETEGAYLGRIDIDPNSSMSGLDNLIDMLKRWGTYPEARSLSGQFSIDGGNACFEIIIHERA